MNAPAIKKWLDVGAQPSDSVRSLLRKAMIIEPSTKHVYKPDKKPKGQKDDEEE